MNSVSQVPLILNLFNSLPFFTVFTCHFYSPRRYSEESYEKRSVRPSIRSSIRPSVRPFDHPSVCPSFRPSLFLSVRAFPWNFIISFDMVLESHKSHSAWQGRIFQKKYFFVSKIGKMDQKCVLNLSKNFVINFY